ncbi:MAG: hypothetical protein H6568_16785 [Lewinellaceae bacterium]|nr:hypothetical protein [Saprospiraceae bacterium]MCB9314413.1 hypothetical protein [Lewinellaceae bacterium]HRW75419.1 hypothetical protein [Saprospiraceae bacterium]
MSNYSPAHIRLALINLLGLVGVLVVNTLANTLPINGVTTGQLSDEYPNLFVPAGLTFAIWGVIYLLLIGFSIYSLATVFQKNATATGKTDFLGMIGPWFLISCLANMMWIVAWHHRMVVLSLVLMIILLTSLIAIYRRLYIGRVVRPLEKMWMHIPFSVYLGWISVATIANVTTLLVHWGWTGGPLREATWAAFLVGIAMGLGLYMVRTRRDFAYALVIIWAFVGIILKRNAVDVEPWTLVPLTAALGIAALVIRMVGTLVKRPA